MTENPEINITDEAGVDASSHTVSVSTEIHEPAEGDLLGQLGISPSLFIAQIINFLIVLLVLWKFAYKPLMRLMDDRTKKIEDGLQKAEDIDKRMDKLEKDREEVLRSARKEAKMIVDDATSTAEAKRESLTTKAKAEVESVVASGKEQIAQQKTQMMAEIKAELASIVVEAARKVSGDAIDSDKAAKNAGDAIESVSL